VEWCNESNRMSYLDDRKAQTTRRLQRVLILTELIFRLRFFGGWSCWPQAREPVLPDPDVVSMYIDSSIAEERG